MGIGIEFGSIGSALGSLGRAGAGAAEGIGRVGAAPTLPGLGRFGVEIAAPVLPINEGVPGLEHIMSSTPLQIGKSIEIRFINEPVKGFDPAESTVPDLSPVNIVAEAESIVTQAQAPLDEKAVLAGVNEVLGIKEPLVEQPVVTTVSSVIPVEAGIHTDNLWIPLSPDTTYQVGDDTSMVFPQVEPMVVPARVLQPDFWPIQDIALSPALQPATKTEKALGVKPKVQPSTGSSVSVEATPAVSPQPLEEQLVKEELVAEKAKEEETGLVETEEVKSAELQDVVDEEVLETRIDEFGEAVDKAEDETREQAETGKQVTEEIDGERVTELLSAETSEKRSGIAKQRGPDGSRVETIEEIKAKRFKSAKEAKKFSVATILSKVPVIRRRQGKRVGPEAVARVLKYLFVKYQPAEKLVERVVKQQKLQTKEGKGPLQAVSITSPKEERTEPRIEDYPGWVEVFPKAA